MNKILTLLLVLFLSHTNSQSQELKFYPTQPKLFGNSIKMPFVGGFQTAFAQQFDLNNDGLKDLIIFDKSDRKILTFIDTSQTSHGYMYDPKYEAYINFISSWFLVRDYDRDGRDDFFVGANGNVSLYRNVSKGNIPEFVLQYEVLTDTTDIIPGLKSNIYVDQVNIPAFEDFDNDGDIDVLTLNILSTYVDYYKNYQVESNLPKDSMVLIFVDPCWGSMGISYFRNDADLGLSCQKYYRHSAAHFGSSFCVLDLDGDGDKDLLHGDVGFDYLTAFNNGKKQFNWPWDTIISTDTGFPRYNKPVSVDLWPAAAYIDLDFDGVKDLFIGSNENMMTQNIHISQFYKNKGTNSKPNFDFVTRDFMGTQLIDMGRASAPAFYDYDNDGDKDMVVGTGWDNQQSKDTSYVLYLYKNIGTDTLPEYTLIDTNWLQINQYKLAPAMPAFGDLNGDGKMDLLIGNSSGRLTYFENQGGNFVYMTNYYDSIDVNLYSAPSIADLNKDGKNDLIIGSNTGNLYYYEKNSNSNYPLFDLKTDSLGKISTAGLFSNEGLSTSAVADIDKNGTLDLMTGALNGEIHLYKNIANYIYTEAPVTDSIYYSYASNSFQNAWYGKRTAPAIHTLDGDTMPDIVIGNIRGGLHFLGTKKEINTTIGIANQVVKREATHINVYPNPANEVLNILYTGYQSVQSYSIFNLIGQEVLSGVINQNKTVLSISDLPQGMYILKLMNKAEESTVKFVKE